MIVRQLETIWASRVLSVLRIIAALLFMEHGTQKLLGFPPSPNPGPALLSVFGIAGVLESIGGALLAAGLFTRPVALLLSGEMAFAYWMVHAPRSFFPVLNGGEPAILLLRLSLSRVRRWRSLEHGRGAESSRQAARPEVRDTSRRELVRYEERT